MSNTQEAAYSVRDIIDRYESEEDEFVRELEEMRRNLKGKEEEIPQDPAPIITVLCNLVDEIGSLRTENRHLKTRLAPSPSRTKNMVQRMSAIFDGRSGSSLIPKIRRPAHAEIRTGARERLSTPPRKECLTTSSVSTDFSDPRTRAPPLVEPELSDSDIDENIFPEDQDYLRRSRRTVPRRCDMSLSEYTSPSSASSSREPSEAMTASRSSIFEILGFRRRRPVDSVVSPLPSSTKASIKKKKRRISQDESTLHYTSSEMFHNRRPPSTKPPRPASYYPREDSEDSDHMRTRKASSFLDVHSRNSVINNRRVDRESQLQHEKDGLAAEIEELKMRNQRLLEQLREKSGQFSKLQVHTNRLEEEVNRLVKRCKYNENVERLFTDERIIRAPTAILEKMEDRLRQFEANVRICKNEINNNCQKAVSTHAQERLAYQNCLEQLERLQKENFTLMKSHYLDETSLEPTLRRKLELLPAYENMCSLTTRAVKKISELRWALIEKTSDLGKAEMEIMNSQANQLILNTQVDRLRLKSKSEWNRPRRPSSFHGGNLTNKLTGPNISAPPIFNYRLSSVDRRKKLNKVKSIDNQAQSLEKEFLSLIGGHSDDKDVPRREYRPESRIEYMMREMGRQKQQKVPYSPVVERRDIDHKNSKRPISMAEVEEEMRQRIQDDSRRNLKTFRETVDAVIRRPSLRGIIQSSQEIHDTRSPTATPVIARRILVNDRMSVRGSEIARPRRIERGYSTESGPIDKNVAEEAILLRQEHHRSVHMEEKRKSINGSARLQRSMPVQVSRIRPPSQATHTQPRSIPRPSETRSQRVIEENRTIPKPDKKSWLEKIRAMKKA